MTKSLVDSKRFLIFDMSMIKTNKMKIDITPTIEKADDFDALCIQDRKIDALYVVRLANGKRYTVKWDSNGLDGFLPKRTVSEMLKSWEETIKRRYETAKTALKTGKHPTFTSEQKLFNMIGEHKVYTGETETVPKKLDKYERAYFKREMADREKEFGELIFYKIVA